MAEYKLNINGKDHTVDVENDTPLLWVLRDNLQLLGTKYGCGIAQCGACTVHVDGSPQRSCQLTMKSIGNSNKEITTIEGLSQDGELHRVQKAWLEHDVPQCGYCQAGQIMSATALLAEYPNPTEKEIENFMNMNLCRCGTYTKIKQAILSAANSENT